MGRWEKEGRDERRREGKGREKEGREDISVVEGIGGFGREDGYRGGEYKRLGGNTKGWAGTKKKKN